MAVSNMNMIRTLVSQLRETQTLACGGGGGCGGGVQTKTIISPKFQISGIYLHNVPCLKLLLHSAWEYKRRLCMVGHGLAMFFFDILWLL